jgi:HlyD family secretion protein
MTKRQRVLIVVVLLTAAAGTWFALRGNSADSQLTLYGNVDIRQVDLAFAVEGPIKEVLVEEGTAVTAGQPLARLDDAPYRHAAAQADAALTQAQAALTKATNGNRLEDIEATRATLAEARARLANAEQVLERRKALRQEGAVSQQSVDDAERDIRVARANVASRQAALRAMEQGLRVEDVDAARGAAAAAQAAADLAHYRLTQTTLTAPADGTVVTRVREPGAMAGPQAPVLSVALSRPVWVRTYVPGPALGRVAPGTKVAVATDDPSGKTYVGTVGFVSPTAEFTPKAVETPELRTDLVYRLRIVVDAPDTALRQGAPVTITIQPPQA